MACILLQPLLPDLIHLMPSHPGQPFGLLYVPGGGHWSVLKQRMRPPQPGCMNRLGSREVAPKAGVHNEVLLGQLKLPKYNRRWTCRWTWRMARRPAGSEQSRCCQLAFVRCHAVLQLAPDVRIHGFGV